MWAENRRWPPLSLEFIVSCFCALRYFLHRGLSLLLFRTEIVVFKYDLWDYELASNFHLSFGLGSFLFLSSHPPYFKGNALMLFFFFLRFPSYLLYMHFATFPNDKQGWCIFGFLQKCPASEFRLRVSGFDHSFTPLRTSAGPAVGEDKIGGSQSRCRYLISGSQLLWIRARGGIYM